MEFARFSSYVSPFLKHGLTAKTALPATQYTLNIGRRKNTGGASSSSSSSSSTGTSPPSGSRYGSFISRYHARFQQQSKDLYEVLEVKRTSSDNEIRLAYKRLCLKFHPDHNPDGREQFESIQMAYQVLKDPEKRKQYDIQQQLHLFAVSPHTTGTGRTHTSTCTDSMSGSMSHNNNATKQQQQQQQHSTTNTKEDYSNDIRHNIECSLEDLFLGKRKKFQIKRKFMCEMCSKQKCPDCPLCNGKLIHSDKKAFKVSIDPGMRHDQSIVFKGQGDKRILNYGNSINRLQGNVVFTVKQIPHSTFTRTGDHLFMKHSLTLTEALTGLFSLDVNHLDGRVLHISSQIDEVDIEHMIRNGEIQCIENEGMPKSRSQNDRGNLYIKFSVTDTPLFNNKRELEQMIKRMKHTIPKKYMSHPQTTQDGTKSFVTPSKVMYEEIAPYLPESFR